MFANVPYFSSDRMLAKFLFGKLFEALKKLRY